MGRQPSSINFVSFLLLLGAAALGYGVWKFFPVYFTAWQVDHVLADGAARAYQVNRIGDKVQFADAKEKLLAALRKEVVELGVADPEMALGMEFTATEVDLHCDYRAIVIHPVGDRYTVITMHRTGSGSLARSPF